MSGSDESRSGEVLNLAAYRFVALQDLPRWKAAVQAAAEELGLKGTVLLAPEGINLFMAGPPGALRRWWVWLLAQEDDSGQKPFADLRAKESWSPTVPFGRLRVRIKREIIRMDTPTIAPQAGRAAAVSAATLRRWLDQGCDDEGHPVLTLDTRNGFEVAEGRFAGALDWNLTRFGEFPQALAQQAHTLRGMTVVSYCTGGIRCEKAALLMRDHGLPRVYQLEGGILQYFEDLPDAPHWEGRCVVFDDRGSLDPDLKPATTATATATTAAASAAPPPQSPGPRSDAA